MHYVSTTNNFHRRQDKYLNHQLLQPKNFQCTPLLSRRLSQFYLKTLKYTIYASDVHMHKWDGEVLQNKSDYERLRLLENKTQFSLKKMRELFLPIEKSSTPTAYVPAATLGRRWEDLRRRLAYALIKNKT